MHFLCCSMRGITVHFVHPSFCLRSSYRHIIFVCPPVSVPGDAGRALAGDAYICPSVSVPGDAGRALAGDAYICPSVSVPGDAGRALAGDAYFYMSVCFSPQ